MFAQEIMRTCRWECSNTRVGQNHHAIHATFLEVRRDTRRESAMSSMIGAQRLLFCDHSVAHCLIINPPVPRQRKGNQRPGRLVTACWDCVSPSLCLSREDSFLSHGTTTTTMWLDCKVKLNSLLNDPFLTPFVISMRSIDKQGIICTISFAFYSSSFILLSLKRKRSCPILL